MVKKETLVLALSAMACSAGNVFGHEKVAIGLTADFMSKYIWRGQNIDDDPVFQPSLSVSYKGFTAAVWGNLEMTNINGNSGEFSEIDYSIDYSSAVPDMKGIGYSVGAIYYDFPATSAAGTTEVYWGLNFDLPLSPSITVYHDVDEAEGAYVSLAAEQSIEKIFELSPQLPVGLDIGASLGWGSGSYNRYYWGTGQSKLQDLVFSVSFPIKVGGWAIAPSLNYVTLLSDTIRDTDAYGTDSDFFLAGVSLAKKF
jgi:hypothetical protein